VLRVGVAGFGYWGPNLVRNLRSLENCRVVGLAEERQDRAALAARLYPDVRLFESAQGLITWDGIDAVLVALPAKFLEELGHLALEAGKSVLLEKPMALSVKEGRGLVARATGAGATAMVDYTFVYSPAIRRIREILESGQLGTPRYYQSTRLSLGPFRSDLDVIWDHMCHDLAILEFILGQRPATVHAAGRPSPNSPMHTASLTVTYQDGFQLFAHASWLAPKKVRTGILACDRGMIVYDDIEPDEKLKIYYLDEIFDPSSEESIAPTYRLGDVHAPRLEAAEPLRLMAANFVNAVLGLESPETDWHFGLRILSILEASSKALATGQIVEVEGV